MRLFSFSKKVNLLYLLLVCSLIMCALIFCANNLRVFCCNKLIAQNTTFEIYNKDDFNTFANLVNGGNFNYSEALLKNDIYFNTQSDMDNNSANSHTIIGTLTNPFSSTFNGNGCTIFGLYNENELLDFFSLFGYTNNATIKNLKFYNVNITNNSSASTLIYNATNTIIDSIEVNGNITSNVSSAGLVNNLNNSTIINSSVSGNITCNGMNAGGIANQSNNSNIINCFNTATIESSNTCGGICTSLNESSSITNCVNNSIIRCTNIYYYTLGAICGYNMGTIQNCYYINTKFNNSNINCVGLNTATNPPINCLGVDNFENEISISVGNNTYTKVLDALNAGTSKFSLNTMALKSWYNASSPQFSSIKQENGFLSELVCENITYPNTPYPSITAKFGSPIYLYSNSENGSFAENIPTNAGTYFVKAIILETDSFTGLESNIISFKIEKASDNITINNNISAMYTGEEFINPTASTLSNSKVIYTYYNSADSDFLNPISSPINCGNYILKLTTLESENYLSASKTLPFSILKRTLTDNTLNKTIIYNSFEHSIDIDIGGFLKEDSINHSTIYYSLDNINFSLEKPTFKNCGTYTIYYKILFENYNTISSYKTLTINKATYTNIYHPALSGTYNVNSTLKDFTLNDGFYWIDSTITPTCNINSYQAYFNLDPQNYFNYTIAITLNLQKQVIKAPEFLEQYYYNGNAQTFSFKNLDSSIILVDYFSKINAGSYNVLLNLADNINYIFENESSSLTLNFVINKANFKNKELNISYSAKYEPNKKLQNYIDILHAKFDIPKFYDFYDKDKIIGAGKHEIWMYYNSDPINYNDYKFSISLEITKASYDNFMFEYTSESLFKVDDKGYYIFVYDGLPKEVFVTGLPQGVSATVFGDGETEVGEYTLSATLTYDPNYFEPTIPPLHYKIIKANLTSFSETDLTFSFENNILKLIYLNGFTTKIKLNEVHEYSPSLYIDNFNEYKVYYIITSKNYEDIIGYINIDLSCYNPEHDTNNDSNNNENNNNNENDNNENNNTNNNNSNNSQNPQEKPNSSPNNKTNNNTIKNTTLISISLIAFLTIIVIVVIKIKKRY